MPTSGGYNRRQEVVTGDQEIRRPISCLLIS
jgi:hypothetical protein